VVCSLLVRAGPSARQRERSAGDVSIMDTHICHFLFLALSIMATHILHLLFWSMFGLLSVPDTTTDFSVNTIRYRNGLKPTRTEMTYEPLAFRTQLQGYGTERQCNASVRLPFDEWTIMVGCWRIRSAR